MSQRTLFSAFICYTFLLMTIFIGKLGLFNEYVAAKHVNAPVYSEITIKHKVAKSHLKVKKIKNKRKRRNN